MNNNYALREFLKSFIITDNDCEYIRFFKSQAAKFVGVNNYYSRVPAYDICIISYIAIIAFLIKHFKQDMLFDCLYEQYVKYVKERDIPDCISSIKFEKVINDFKLFTYKWTDDDYNSLKCVSFIYKPLYK